MRIALCDYSGHPFQVELSRCLARRGHSVLHLHFAEFETPKAGLNRCAGDPSGFTVESVSLGRPFDKQGYLRRRAQEAKVGRMMAARIAEFRAELAVGCNMPLDAQRNLARGCAAAGTAFVFWLQDIYSAAIRHYLTRRFGLAGAVIGGGYARLEGALLRQSQAVVAISDAFRPPLARWGVDPSRVAVIPNWAPLSDIGPTRKENAWAGAHGFSDKCVALYSGTLGLKHDPALLMALAKAGNAVDLKVLVVSEGPAARQLAEQARRENLQNLTMLPFQPIERYAEVLGAGDIMLAMISEEAAGFSVPSKILSYLAAGKPIVAAIPHENDAARTVREAEAGLVTPPGDTAAFISAVLGLSADADRRDRFGRNARGFAERCFSIDAIADRFEKLFAEALGRVGEAAPR